MTWINHKWFFRKRENKFLINALFKASEKYSNDQALGAVIRNFCNTIKANETFTEDQMYNVLMEQIKKYKHKP
jgi:hypothetical protein